MQKRHYSKQIQTGTSLLFFHKPVELQVLVLGGGVGGPAEVVLVRLQLSVHGLQQHLVGGLAGDEAGLVHQGHDANVRLVDQAADDLRRNILQLYGVRDDFIKKNLENICVLLLLLLLVLILLSLLLLI